MDPTVLHFIVCDRVYTNPDNLHSINIEGLRTLIRSKETPRFPLAIPGLHIVAIIMGGEGVAEFSFRIVHGEAAFKKVISTSTHPHRIHFVGDPYEIKGMKTRVENCIFRKPGLYWVELLCSGEVLARQPLRVVS